MRSALSFVRMAFIRLFNIRSFHCGIFQDFAPSARILIHGGKVNLGNRIHARRNVTLEADGGIIEIGDGCFINEGCMAVAKGHIRIGEYTSFGPNVFIYDHDHDIHSGKNIHDSGFMVSDVIIGKNVWIGANTVILRGSVIGDGCVIGAGSVIKGTYEKDSVVLQKRSEEIKIRNGGKEVSHIV